MEQKQKEKQKDEWEMIESFDFFRFEKIGDKLEGLMTEKNPPIGEKKFGMYALKPRDGNEIRFHGSAQLDDLLRPINIGDEIRIEYMNQKKMPKGQMKEFRVSRRTA